MALEKLGIFAAGVAAGWVGRSVSGSTREALVRVIVAGHRLRDEARLALGERAEWIEDLIAEGRLRYDAAHSAPPDEEAPPHIVHRSEGRAA